jgi:hypothetical protein
VKLKRGGDGAMKGVARIARRLGLEEMGREEKKDSRRVDKSGRLPWLHFGPGCTVGKNRVKSGVEVG